MSLVPSITETLLSWGRQPLAVTRFCDAPGVRAVGGTKNPDIEAIAGLDAEVVLMDREENRKEDAARLEQLGLKVVATDVRGLEDVAPAMSALADAIGVGEDVVGPPPRTGRTTVSGSPPHRFRVWIPIWRRPWMTIGPRTYGSTLLAAAGFDNVFDDPADAYPTMDPDVVKGREPDLVLAPSEPYPFAERHRADLEAVAPVVFVDGQDVFWWGARTPGALARLRELARTLSRR